MSVISDDFNLSVRKDYGRESISSRPTVLRVATVAMSLCLLRGQFAQLRDAGYDVVLVTAPGPELDEIARKEKVAAVGLPIEREIAPWQDVISLYKLWRLIRKQRPTLVDSATPKAGLLGGLAACFALVPCRVHSLWGLRSETLIGPKRWIVWFCEAIACRSASLVVCVSESLRQKAIALHLVNPDRIIVLGSGSSNGIDAQRFAPTADALHRAALLRANLRIPGSAPVIGFVGRLTRDKGIPELLDAYLQLRRGTPNLRLLLVGATEKGDQLPPQTLNVIHNDPQITCTGFVSDTADYYHMMDVLALPTRREGFGTVVLEAHAASKPVVAAKATGAVDAVIDGVDGILVTIGDSISLARALAQILGDKDLAATMGRAGRERVLREFRQDRIWTQILWEYSRLLRRKGFQVSG